MSKTCPVCNTIYPDSDAFCPKDGSTLRLDEGSNTLVGSVIADRYLVSRLLGEGGMGQVYLAGHVRLPQQAAIKVLHASMVQDAAAVARFNREAANAARIEHDRVARVFDFGETSDGLVYLAMEFVPGLTLRELLESSGRLPPVRAANIVYQVAEGLDAAHRISIVHRDLKPDNVLVVTDENGVDRCKVVDFGIAKALNDSDGKKTQLTQVGAIIGTPEYMSPEQVLGETIDARSDVYALAVVAFHLLSGALPFSASTPERTLTARLIGPPRSLTDAAPDIAWPEAVQAAFDQALAGDPQDRTPSALVFAETLVAAVEGWTGSAVLRGRTPLSMIAIPTPSMSSAVADAVASMPTLAMAGPPGATSAAATQEKSGAAGAVSVTSGSTAVSPSSGRSGDTASESVASRSTGATSASSSRRSPLLWIGGVVAVAAVAAFFVLQSGGSESAVAPSLTTNATIASGEGTTASDPAEQQNASRNDALPAGNSTPANPTQSGEPIAAQSDGAASGTERTPSADGARGAGASSAGASGDGAPSVGAAGIPGAANGPTAGGETAGNEDAAAARRTLDSLVRAVADPDVPIAMAAIPQFERVLARLPSATDSFRVYSNLAILHGVADNQLRACTSLRAARRLATSDGQLTMVVNMTSMPYYARCP